MAKFTGLLTIFLIIVLLVAAPVGAFSLSGIAKFILKPFASSTHARNVSTASTSQQDLAKQIEETKPILQKYDAGRNDDIVAGNEDILNKTCCWYDIKAYHNPAALPIDDRMKLFETCSDIIRPFIDRAYRQALNPAKDWYYTSEIVAHYNLLLCVQGYPVYQSKIVEMVQNGITPYSEDRVLLQYNEIFPLVINDKTLDRNELWDLWKKYDYIKSGDLEFLFKKGDTEDKQFQQSVNKNVRISPNAPATSSTTDANSQINSTINYDFPKIEKNKQDIYDSFNYNSIVQKILKDYSKIGVDVEGEGYTFQVTDGRISDITKGMDSDSSVKIYTNWKELKKLITLHQEGNLVSAIPTLLGMNIQPSTAKFKVLKNIKQ
ncbi:hypothetical protein HYU17_01710 [Candidatus Woesearchaeota archaeon]|nr:hypothetical protein [Candidatus Woesearchaeota archaeon]